jgi:hypothetical protein
MFASLIGTVPKKQLDTLRKLADSAQWKVIAGRGYQTAFISPPEGYKSAFFLKLPPLAAIHAHVDANDCKTEHIVIETNRECLNYCMEGDKECSQHMDQGKRYEVNRGLLHWAVNDGDSDRIHLLLES